MKRTLLTNAVITTGEYSKKGALAIEGDHIAGIWLRTGSDVSDEKAVSEFPDAETIDLQGMTLMAGGVDLHVHFREPGLTHKADIGTESKAALLGGVTSFVDMPNTKPATTTVEALNDKLEAAQGRSWANYGFHLGATNENAGALRELLGKGEGNNFGGIKVFMGSSTGNMLVDESAVLRDLFSIHEKSILVHCEDEGIIKANLKRLEESGMPVPFSCHPAVRSRSACIRSTAKALQMAIEYGTRLHLLHVSTAEEVEMVRAAKIHNPSITAETSPNYLWFCDEDYDTLEGKVKCNPAIKSSADREALRKGLAEGIIDTVGTDHAPHLLSEKAQPYLSCPSGMPSIQHCLSVLLSIEGLPLSRIASAFSEKPAEILGIRDRGEVKVGNYADLVVVNTEETYSVTSIAYKCGWSPLEGSILRGSVKFVFLNGGLAVSDNQVVSGPAGKRLICNSF